MSAPMPRKALEELRAEFDELVNVLMFKSLAHKCGFSCTCTSKGNTIQRLIALVVRTVFYRRPKRPEIKEWTAIGHHT